MIYHDIPEAALSHLILCSVLSNIFTNDTSLSASPYVSISLLLSLSMKVMTVLRDNNDSLVATLEAFVHDPLISWRLLNIDRCAFTSQHTQHTTAQE